MLLGKFVKAYCYENENILIRFEHTGWGEEQEYDGIAKEIPEILLSNTMVQKVRARIKKEIPCEGIYCLDYGLVIFVRPVFDYSGMEEW